MFTRSGLGALFIGGLALRLILARGGGFPFDMSSFGAWAGTLADKGPWGFYPFSSDSSFFIDYPPGYLYVLWVIGLISKIIWNAGPPVFLIKLPPMLADLGLAWVVGTLAERLASAGLTRRLPVRAIAAGAILFNPAIFFISAVWGQADTVLALLVVGAFLYLGTGERTFAREAAGFALLAVAFGTKPQAVFVVPIAVLIVAWRRLRVPLLDVDDAGERRRRLLLGVRHLAGLAAAGVAAGFLLFAPFGMHPARALDFYVRASRTYKVTSVFAFNFWGAIGFWKADSGNENVVRILGIPAVIWGIVLFIALGGLVLARAWRALSDGEDEGRVLVFGGVALTLVSFAVVTRVHERYLFLPIALLAVFAAHRAGGDPRTPRRWLRRALVVLSVLYLVNVYLPYVYYLDYVKRPSPKLWGLYDLLYGNDIGGGRVRLLCIIVGVTCLLMAWRGWRSLAPSPDPAEEPAPPLVALPEERVEDAEPVPRPKWSLGLHGIGRRGALIAVAVFAVAFVARVAGLGHPPGMFFDEVYHGRAGAEYLAHKEVFEYTHPPLAKEIIGFSIHRLSGFGTSRGSLPDGVDASTVAPGTDGVVWARADGDGSRIERGEIDASCRARTRSTVAALDLRADAVAASTTSVFVAGTSDGVSELVRLQGSTESWRASLPGPAEHLAVIGERAFVVTDGGDLVIVSSEGEPDAAAVGADGLSAAGNSSEVWVSFPEEKKIAAWDGNGNRTSTIDTPGEPRAIVGHRGSERVFVTVGDEIVSYETERDTEQTRIQGGASLLGNVPGSSIVWAVHGTGARAIEPLSGSVVGRVRFDRAADALTADPVRHRLVAVSGDEIECASGRPQFAWRLGSAITGALMVAFVFLIAMRLFGNVGIAIIAALFLAIDGLAFTISRIAMNDSYAMAGALGAWFCTLSALYASGRRNDAGAEPRRGATIAWLFAAGVLGGAGLASKWPALYALAGIGLLVLWDGFDRRERSLWRVAGGFLPSAALVLLAMVVTPLAVYFVTYIPYMSLGHSFSDTLRLQRSMFDYHSSLTATHPFGSPWYGWPIGYRAVYLYVHSAENTRAEMWTFPNLVVFWGGLVALAYAAREAVRKRSVAIGLLVAAAVIQYLPWTLVSRVAFMYHYLPVVPFLALALAWFLAEGLKGRPLQRTVLSWTIVAAIAFFFFTYPVLVGWQMPIGYLDATRAFSWVIP
jgi:dolichyl-phosphate-mannose--protein O-mannosyl transferase